MNTLFASLIRKLHSSIKMTQMELLYRLLDVFAVLYLSWRKELHYALLCQTSLLSGIREWDWKKTRSTICISLMYVLKVASTHLSTNGTWHTDVRISEASQPIVVSSHPATSGSVAVSFGAAGVEIIELWVSLPKLASPAQMLD